MTVAGSKDCITACIKEKRLYNCQQVMQQPKGLIWGSVAKSSCMAFVILQFIMYCRGIQKLWWDIVHFSMIFYNLDIFSLFFILQTHCYSRKRKPWFILENIWCWQYFFSLKKKKSMFFCNDNLNLVENRWINFGSTRQE